MWQVLDDNFTEETRQAFVGRTGNTIHSSTVLGPGKLVHRERSLKHTKKGTGELQKERLGLVKGFLGDAFKQGDIGFQEGLGGFNSPSSFSLTREDRITRISELEAGKTTAREKVQEPFRNAALQRQIRLKQTPASWFVRIIP